LTVPPRRPEIPNYREREALQSLRHGRWADAQSLHPAGPVVIAGMVRKGWIEENLDTKVPAYRITEPGRAAFSAKITRLR